MKQERQPLYGLLAEFDDPKEVVSAARRTYEEGYRNIDVLTPFPIEGLSEAVGYRFTPLPLIVFFGGILGFGTGYLLQYYLTVIDYPLNVGGRPLHSWPAFVPVTFEMTILAAALSAVLGMLALNRLPTPYHPLFNVARFELASDDRFFLLIEATDRYFDLEATRRFLQSLNPREVFDVEC